MTYRVYLVEDDAKIANAIAEHLAMYGYQARVAQDFACVEPEFLQYQPHLVLMDVNLPYQNGFHLTRMLRRHSSVPILFVSARTGEMEQILGMESGGDDYVTKPVNLDVLLAKVRAMLRRVYGDYAAAETAPRALLRVGGLELDMTAVQLRFRGAAQPLAPNEMKLLRLFMEKPDRLVTREACLEALWDDSAFVDDNTLTVNVGRVRAKLDAFGLRDALETRRGLGYVLIRAKVGDEA